MWNTNFQSTAFTYSIHLGLISFIILKKKIRSWDLVTSQQIEGEKVEAVTDFIFGGL